jgi:catechol 2,3-dioxygenase-like lactoylglutathione lyase family enzyme
VIGVDHIAFPTADAARLAAFYAALGFALPGFDDWQAGRAGIFSIACGNQKINVHPETLVAMRGNSAYLRADTAEPGCVDLCVVWEGGIDALLDMLAAAGVTPIAGPVPRIGGREAGTAAGVSVYVRDPDHNLLEFISYDVADFEAYEHLGPPR